VLSDGLDNKSLETPQTVLSFYDTEAESRNVGFSTYALGLGGEIDRGGLGNLVTRTGGLYMETPQAEDLADLYQDILYQIQNEYLLEYTSPVSSTPGQIIDVTIGVNAVSSYTPGRTTYRSPGLSKALARALWPGMVIIGVLLAVLIIATIFKLSRRAWVTAMITPFEGKDFQVGEMGGNIGNSEICDIRLAHDPAILPLHASISETFDGFVLEAADPENSPIVVDRRALARKLLRNGDRFSLGHTTFVFHEKVQRPDDGKELTADDAISLPQITEAAQQSGTATVKGPPRRLVCDSGPHEGTSFELAQGENTIGRSGENTISLPNDSQISRKHCTIGLGGSSATLTDHGSTNGTSVNGARCQPGMANPVVASDSLIIGTNTFHLE
jgi:pSer/pThr/pTyr-binding forkhead associated (FHA) protein